MGLFQMKPSPKNIAHERLKLILMNDRNELSDELLEEIKHEILHAVNKYIEIDISDIRISFTKNEYNDKNYSELIANIPLKK